MYLRDKGCIPGSTDFNGSFAVDSCWARFLPEVVAFMNLLLLILNLPISLCEWITKLVQSLAEISGTLSVFSRFGAVLTMIREVIQIALSGQVKQGPMLNSIAFLCLDVTKNWLMAAINALQHNSISISALPILPM